MVREHLYSVDVSAEPSGRVEVEKRVVDMMLMSSVMERFMLALVCILLFWSRCSCGSCCSGRDHGVDEIVEFGSLRVCGFGGLSSRRGGESKLSSYLYVCPVLGKTDHNQNVTSDQLVTRRFTAKIHDT